MATDLKLAIKAANEANYQQSGSTPAVTEDTKKKQSCGY